MRLTFSWGIGLKLGAQSWRHLPCARLRLSYVCFDNTRTASILGADAVGTVVEPSGHPLHGKRVLPHTAVNWLEDESGPDGPKQFGIVCSASLSAKPSLPDAQLGGTRQTEGRGTFAEYLAIPADHVVEAPSHLNENLAAAAALPLGGLTAYR